MIVGWTIAGGEIVGWTIVRGTIVGWTIDRESIVEKAILGETTRQSLEFVSVL